MTRGVGEQSPANVQTYLKGIAYPATKEDLVQQLREGEYGGPQDVMKAYGQVK